MNHPFYSDTHQFLWFSRFRMMLVMDGANGLIVAADYMLKPADCPFDPVQIIVPSVGGERGYNPETCRLQICAWGLLIIASAVAARWQDYPSIKRALDNMLTHAAGIEFAGKAAVAIGKGWPLPPEHAALADLHYRAAKPEWDALVSSIG